MQQVPCPIERLTLGSGGAPCWKSPRRWSGTGHGSYRTFPRAAASVTGDAKSYDFVGDNGTVCWASVGPAWDRIDPDVPTFDKMPPMAPG